MSAHPAGRMVVALAMGGRARVLAVVIPGPAAETAQRHNLGVAASKRAGEATVAACLLAAHVKGEERLTLDIQATSPPFAAVVEVAGDGTLRARFRPEELRDQALFFGAVSAMKSLGPKELYRSVVMVEGETVEGMLQRLLDASQQVQARVRLLVEVDDAGAVTQAAGLLIEALPGLDPGEFRVFADTTTGDFKETMEAFAFGMLGGEPLDVIGGTELVYSCRCSRDRVRATLRALGPAEITGMIADQGGAEVTCHFCNECYRFDVPELERMREGLAEA